MADSVAGLLAGQGVLVTGGASGIGKATATGLAAMGVWVGITGRAAARTLAAADAAGAAGNLAVDRFAADASSRAEVRRLAGEVLAAHLRLDVLVSNAGGFWATRRVTADGLGHAFAVNHLAPFLLIGLLWERLTSSAPARIVTVSFGVHIAGKIGFGDRQGGHCCSGQQAYSPSKLANIMFTCELSRCLAGTGITAIVLHPGVVRTGSAAEDSTAT
jgi:retinol dehydrogenase-14